MLPPPQLSGRQKVQTRSAMHTRTSKQDKCASRTNRRPRSRKILNPRTLEKFIGKGQQHKHSRSNSRGMRRKKMPCRPGITNIDSPETRAERTLHNGERDNGPTRSGGLPLPSNRASSPYCQTSKWGIYPKKAGPGSRNGRGCATEPRHTTDTHVASGLQTDSRSAAWSFPKSCNRHR